MPAIRVHHTATSDSRWDGPGTEAKIADDATASTLRGFFAWIDPDKDATKKEAYRFIHHEIGSSGDAAAANIRACVSGIGVLNGARGGTTIPSADRDGVYRHLAAHIKDSGGTPPELKNMNRETKRLDIELQIKSLSDDGTFTGDLSVYDFVDYGGDVTVKGCFTKTLQESGAKVPMLWQHDMSRPIGVMSLTDGDTALECKGVLNMDMPDAKAAYSMMNFNKKNGIASGLSMGYIPMKDSVKSGIRYLEEVKLLEGSIVTIAANRLCAVSEVKAAGVLASQERKEFADELENIQVYALFSQIIQALYSELCNVMYGSDDAPTAQKGAGDAFSAASSAFSDYVSRYFGESESDGMETAAFPDTTFGEKIIAGLEKKLEALRAKSRATAQAAGAAANAGAAAKPNEPGASHSGELQPEAKAAVSNFVKEIFDGLRKPNA